MTFPNQHNDTNFPYRVRNHVLVSGIVKNTRNLDVESTSKTRSIVNNVDRTLTTKRMLMFGSKKIYTFKKSAIYDTYIHIKDEKTTLMQ